MSDQNNFDVQGPAFAHSSQRKYWTFSHAKLEETRVRTHARAIRRFEQPRRSRTPQTTRQRMSMGTPGDLLVKPSVEPTPDTNKRMSMESSVGTDVKPVRMSMSPAASRLMTPDSKSIVKTISFDASPGSKSGANTPEPSTQPVKSPARTPNNIVQLEEKVATTKTEATTKTDDGKYLVPIEPDVAVKKMDCLNQADEAVMRLYWEKYIQKIVTQLFPVERGRLLVMASALTYFKRFYLVNSVMDHNPRHIMVTCVNMANKAEEWMGRSGVDLTKLSEVTKTKAEKIVHLEVPLLDSIRFHLRIFHPYKPLKGHIAAVQKLSAEAKWGPELVEKLEATAISLISTVFFTDAPLLYYPSQIALAALSLATEREGPAVFQPVKRYIEAECSRDPEKAAALLAATQQTLTAIKALLEAGAQAVPDVEQAKILDRKLKHFNKLVAKEAKLENERKRAEKDAKRAKKHEERRLKQEQREAGLLMPMLLKSPAGRKVDDSDEGDFMMHKRFKPTPER